MSSTWAIFAPLPTTSSRLLALPSLLQSRRDWLGEVLADRLAVSPRTVRRDIDLLRGLGYRIATFKGPDGGYRLAAGTDLPPLLFDDDRVIALAVALQVAATEGVGLGPNVEEAALRALTTVRQVLPTRLRHRLDRLPIAVVQAPGGVRTELLQAFGMLARRPPVRHGRLGDPRPPGSRRR